MAKKTLSRIFKHGSIVLPDPNPSLSASEVRDSYASTYPELATALIKGPDYGEGTETYTFKEAIGAKG